MPNDKWLSEINIVRGGEMFILVMMLPDVSQKVVIFDIDWATLVK